MINRTKLPPVCSFHGSCSRYPIMYVKWFKRKNGRVFLKSTYSLHDHVLTFCLILFSEVLIGCWSHHSRQSLIKFPMEVKVYCVKGPQSVNIGGRRLLRERSASWSLPFQIEMFWILSPLPQLRQLGIGDKHGTILPCFSDFAQQLSG